MESKKMYKVGCSIYDEEVFFKKMKNFLLNGVEEFSGLIGNKILTYFHEFLQHRLAENVDKLKLVLVFRLNSAERIILVTSFCKEIFQWAEHDIIEELTYKES